MFSPALAISGGSLQVSDTVLNQGGGNAGASTTGFYLSTNGVTKGTYLGYRYVGALGAGVKFGTSDDDAYVADQPEWHLLRDRLRELQRSGIVESNTANNCTASPRSGGGADLVESAVSVLTSAPISGGSLQVSDTVLNQGGGNAGASTTGFYLSTNGTSKTNLPRLSLRRSAGCGRKLRTSDDDAYVADKPDWHLLRDRLRELQ